MGRQGQTKVFPFKAILTIVSFLKALQVYNLWGMLIQNRYCWSFPEKTYFLEWEKWVFRTQLALFCSPLSADHAKCTPAPAAKHITSILGLPRNVSTGGIVKYQELGEGEIVAQCKIVPDHLFTTFPRWTLFCHINIKFDLIKWK